VAANKMDVAGPDLDATVSALEKRAKSLKLPFYRVSGASGAGVPDLLEAMWRTLAAARANAA